MKKILMGIKRGILAGICISVAAVAYLSAESAVAGGFLFGLGLLSIYTFNWDLYTGKCCYMVEHPKEYAPQVLTSFIGNMIGTIACGYLIRLSGLHIIETADAAVVTKLGYELYEAFILAIFCGIMMCIAVKGYKAQKTEIGKAIIVLFPVCIFIIAHFEHSIANLFYFSLANAWSGEAVLYIFICALGNLVGCSVLPFLQTLGSKGEAETH
ncbi:MAG: formate/nitrite transporter family protein [Bacillota bacterium]